MKKRPSVAISYAIPHDYSLNFSEDLARAHHFDENLQDLLGNLAWLRDHLILSATKHSSEIRVIILGYCNPFHMNTTALHLTYRLTHVAEPVLALIPIVVSRLGIAKNQEQLTACFEIIQNRSRMPQRWPNSGKTIGPYAPQSGLSRLPVILKTLDPKDHDVAEIQAWVREMFLLHEQILHDKIDLLGSGFIDDRVFELLKHLIRRFGQQLSPHRYQIPPGLTRAQMGRLVDGRVETIIRLLNRWQNAGLLHWNKDGIVIENLALLEKNLQSNK